MNTRMSTSDIKSDGQNKQVSDHHFIFSSSGPPAYLTLLDCDTGDVCNHGSRPSSSYSSTEQPVLRVMLRGPSYKSSR